MYGGLLVMKCESGRMKVLLSLMLTTALVTQPLSVKVLANEKSNTTSVVATNSDITNLKENLDSNRILCEKLTYDRNRDITNLSEDVERELNEAGVFDSEIEKLDDETLKTLEASINTEVYISYMLVDDLNNEITELNNNEIDELLKEKIEEGVIDFEKQEDSFFKEALKWIGILPEDVYASSVYHSGYAAKSSSSGAVKQTIYACQYQKGGTIYVTASATWLDEAYYRNKDVFGVSISNATIVSNSYSCSHTATYKRTTKTQTTQSVKSEKPKAYIIGGAGDAIAYTVDLFDSRSRLTGGGLAGAGKEEYIDEQIIVKFRCNVSNRNIKTVTLVPHYMHAQTETSITPSVSVSASGISVGISGSSKKYHQEITNNPILNYNYK